MDFQDRWCNMWNGRYGSGDVQMESGVAIKLMEMVKNPSLDEEVVAWILTQVASFGRKATAVEIARDICDSAANLLMSRSARIWEAAGRVISEAFHGPNDGGVEEHALATLIGLLIQNQEGVTLDIKREIGWALLTATQKWATKSQKLLASNCPEGICKLISTEDEDLICIGLKGLENLLRLGDGPGAKMIKGIMIASNVEDHIDTVISSTRICEGTREYALKIQHMI